MSSIMWKKFNKCLSKIKCLSPPLPSNELENNNQTATSSIVINNFNYLYNFPSTSASISHSSHVFSSSDDQVSDHSDTTQTTPPDFSTLFASQQRFFFSSPGQSNSIFECSTPSTPPESDTLAHDSIAFSKYSPDPYMDFRESMQEMVKAKDSHLINVEDKCNYLHELLVCYLSLNPKHAHKYIISAFSDLILALLSEKRSENTSVQPRSKVSRRLF